MQRVNVILQMLSSVKKLLYIRKFSREFNFRETSHMRSFVKIKPSNWRLLIKVNHALFAAIFLRRKFYVFTAIRENKILAKVSELTVYAPVNEISLLIALASSVGSSKSAHMHNSIA